jgi:3-hydroxyisobutyrate dehydrogenase
MGQVKVGFIGCGEVGATFAKTMREKGAEIAVYDILFSQTDGERIIQSRLQTGGIQFCSLIELIDDSDYILSVVTTQTAKDVAKACKEHLKQNQIYIDLNSTSPKVKVDLSKIIEGSGCHFVEGAILGAVGATGSRTRILVTGEKGKKAAETLTKLGLNVSYYAPEIGKASIFKMLRSIFSKGLENIMLELLIAGKRAGIEKDLWEDIIDFMSQKSFAKIASNWVQTHAIAYERRYHEMVQVVETMREIGIEPIMTIGTEAFFKRSLSLGFQEKFSEKPESFEDVVDFMEQRLHASK